MKSNLFFVAAYATDTIFKRALPTLMSRYFCPISFQKFHRSYIRSLIHFNFCRLYQKVSNFIPLHMDIQFSQHFLLKRPPCATEYTWFPG